MQMKIPTGRMETARKLEVLRLTRPAVRGPDGKEEQPEKEVGFVLGIIGEVTALKDAATYATFDAARASIKDDHTL
jgi:hypothetical protein